MSMQTRTTSRMLTGKDILRQKLGNELRQAPWNEGTSEQPLQELKRLMKTVKPAHQEFWDNLDKDMDTFLRLNAAAKKLEASQPEAKEDATPQTNLVEDQVSPRDACVLSPACRTPPAEMQQGHFARGVDRGSP